MPRKVEPKPAPGKFKIGRTIMFSPDLLAAIDAVADLEGRSFSSMVCRLVEDSLAKPKRRAAA